MNDCDERKLQAHIKQVMDADTQALSKDSVLQRDLALARQQALASSKERHFGFIGWGSAIVVSLLLAVVWIPNGVVEQEAAIDPLLLELEGELDLDIYVMDAEFYQWVADEADSAS